MHDRLGSDSTSGGSGKTLLLVAGEAVAAAEWQLRWELPPGSAAPAAQAAAVLHRLRINPRCGSAAEASAAALRRQVWLPPPLAASLTVVLTAESGSLSLLAPAPLPLLHGQGGTAAPSKQQQPPQQQPGGMQQQAARGSSAPPVALLDAVAVLHLGGLKAALHSYPSPEDSSLLAGDLQAQLALCLPDSSSAVAPAGTLLAAAAPGAAVVQPFLLDCAVEYSSCSDAFHLQQPAAAEQLGQQQQAAEAGSTGGGSSGNAQGSAPQLPFWQAQAAHQPGELPLLAVRPPPAGRGLGVALAAQQQPVVVNASEAALAEVRHLVAALSAGPADNSSSGLSPAAPTAPLLLINRSGMALRVRQEGNPAQGHLLLQDGQRQSLLWPAPPALVPGAVRRLQLAPAAAAEGDESAWSAPVDVSARWCACMLFAPQACRQCCFLWDLLLASPPNPLPAPAGDGLWRACRPAASPRAWQQRRPLPGSASSARQQRRLGGGASAGHAAGEPPLLACALLPHSGWLGRQRRWQRRSGTCAAAVPAAAAPRAAHSGCGRQRWQHRCALANRGCHAAALAGRRGQRHPWQRLVAGGVAASAAAAAGSGTDGPSQLAGSGSHSHCGRAGHAPRCSGAAATWLGSGAAAASGCIWPDIPAVVAAAAATQQHAVRAAPAASGGRAAAARGSPGAAGPPGGGPASRQQQAAGCPTARRPCGCPAGSWPRGNRQRQPRGTATGTSRWWTRPGHCCAAAHC